MNITIEELKIVPTSKGMLETEFTGLAYIDGEPAFKVSKQLPLDCNWYTPLVAGDLSKIEAAQEFARTKYPHAASPLCGLIWELVRDRVKEVQLRHWCTVCNWTVFHIDIPPIDQEYRIYPHPYGKESIEHLKKRWLNVVFVNELYQ
jgi:hypothetical protein